MDETNFGTFLGHAVGAVPERTSTKDLGCYEWLLGSWEIRYPDQRGMIQEDYLEQLELGADLRYRWHPAPLWAKPSGYYGVTRLEEGLKLYFEQRGSRPMRGNHLVPIAIGTSEGNVIALNWQRKFNHAVVFSDRVFVARRPRQYYNLRAEHE